MWVVSSSSSCLSCHRHCCCCCCFSRPLSNGRLSDFEPCWVAIKPCQTSKIQLGPNGETRFVWLWFIAQKLQCDPLLTVAMIWNRFLNCVSVSSLWQSLTPVSPMHIPIHLVLRPAMPSRLQVKHQLNEILRKKNKHSCATGWKWQAMVRWNSINVICTLPQKHVVAKSILGITIDCSKMFQKVQILTIDHAKERRVGHMERGSSGNDGSWFSDFQREQQSYRILHTSYFWTLLRVCTPCTNLEQKLSFQCYFDQEPDQRPRW